MSRNKDLVPYLFLAPFLAVLTVFFLYATVRAAYFSFTDYNLFDPPKWVGFRNYLNLFKEQNFIRALWNSVSFAAVVSTVQTLAALVVASALNSKIRGVHFFRAAFYMPSVASSVVISLIFLWLYQRKGALNFIIAGLRRMGPYLAVGAGLFLAVQTVQVLGSRRRAAGKEMPEEAAAPWDPAFAAISLMISGICIAVLHLLGIIEPGSGEPVDFIWLQTREKIAGIPIPLIAIMLQNIFTTIPTLMLIFLAGLQDVPTALYEAAMMDGANAPKRLLHITIPSLRPVLFLVVTMSLIGTLQMFDQVAIFGNAVPLESVITLAYFTYDRMFPGAMLPEAGLASASALFLATFTLCIVLLQRLFLKSEAQ